MKAFIKEFTKDIPRGVVSRFLNQQRAPLAKWYSPENILNNPELEYDPDNPGNKILIGALGNKLIGIEDNRHNLTGAGSRSGKSVTLINNLFFYRGSVLATDPKGELAEKTAEARADLGQKICILDPFNYVSDELKKYRVAYNPLSILTLDSPTVIEDASIIVDAMVVKAAGDKDPHWDESAQNLIEGIILLVVASRQFEGQRNLITVRNLIMNALHVDYENGDQERPYYVLEQLMLNEAQCLKKDEKTTDIGNAIEGAASDFYDKSDRERDGVLSTVRRHTKFLDYTAMRKILTGHDFDLADLKRNPKGMTVYLCFPATRIEISKRWLRIFINQLLDAMEREKTKPPASVLVCLDEFPALGFVSQLQSAIGLIASFHVKLWVVLQDWNQGKALYKERWESFAANSGLMQFFNNTDVTTTEYISKLLGKTQVIVSRHGEVNQQQKDDGITGKSGSTQLYSLMQPDEISRKFSRNDRLKRQLVIWAGYPPMILQRVEYYDKKGPFYHLFKNKLNKAILNP